MKVIGRDYPSNRPSIRVKKLIRTLLKVRNVGKSSTRKYFYAVSSDSERGGVYFYTIRKISSALRCAKGKARDSKTAVRPFFPRDDFQLDV